MSIDSDFKISHTGNGTTATYQFNFLVQQKSHVRVFVTDATTGLPVALAGEDGVLLETTHYTIADDQLNKTSGNIVLVNGAFEWIDGSGFLDTGYRITLSRVVTIEQTTDIRNLGTFYPEIHENTFDYSRMIDQQQENNIQRSIRIDEAFDKDGQSVSLVATLDPTAANNAGKGFVFNTDGTQIELVDISEADHLVGETPLDATSDNRIIAHDNPAGLTDQQTQTRPVTIDDTGNTVPVTDVASSLGAMALRWLKGWFQDLDISGDMLPAVDSTSSVGSTTLRFLKGWFDTVELTNQSTQNGVDILDQTNTITGITNKTFTSPTINNGLIDLSVSDASATNKIVVSSHNDFATLSGIAREEGSVYYDRGGGKYYGDDGINLIDLGGGGGASAGARWFPNAGGPLEDVEYNDVEVLRFSKLGVGSAAAFLNYRVPRTHTSGQQHKCRLCFYSPDAGANEWRMQITIYLIREDTGDNLGSTGVSTLHTSADQVNGTANSLNWIEFSLSDGSGQIAGNTVDANDYLVLKLERLAPATGTEDNEDVRLVMNSTEIYS